VLVTLWWIENRLLLLHWNLRAGI